MKTVDAHVQCVFKLSVYVEVWLLKTAVGVNFTKLKDIVENLTSHLLGKRGKF